jgi:hypothetical protein
MAKPKPKPKKLTQREKSFRAQFKKEIQKKGVIAPDKPRLNRKKFAQETMAAFKDLSYGDAIYLFHAINATVPDGSKDWRKISPEDVGALKVVAAAVAWKRFEAENRQAGKENYSIGELFDNVLKPIRDL